MLFLGFNVAALVLAPHPCPSIMKKYPDRYNLKVSKCKVHTFPKFPFARLFCLDVDLIVSSPLLPIFDL